MLQVLWHKDMADSWLRYIRTYCAGKKTALNAGWYSIAS